MQKRRVWQETAIKALHAKTFFKFWQRPLIKCVRIAGLLANCYNRLLHSPSIIKKKMTRRYKEKKTSWQENVASGDLAAEMREAQRNKLTHYWPTYGTSRSHFCGVLPGSPGKRKLPATHSTCPLIPSAENKGRPGISWWRDPCSNPGADKLGALQRR